MQAYVNIRTVVMLITAFILLNLTWWLQLPAANGIVGSLVWLYAELFLYLILVNTVMRLYTGWSIHFTRTIRRIGGGQAERVIEELNAQRAAGDHDLVTLILLSSAHAYLGQGEQAYSVSQDMMRIAAAEKVCDSRSLSLRMKCEYVRIARSDALIALGRFSEAAHSLRPGASTALQPNFMITLVAWAFFLAGDSYNTEVVLRQVKPVRAYWQKYETLIPPKYHLMAAYMRYRVLGENTLNTLHKLKKHFSAWEKEAELNRENPYGARLHTILGDLAPLLQRDAEGMIG